MTIPSNRDQIYRHKKAEIGDFKFDDGVADVFDDMIVRSVPGYEMTIAMLPILVRRFAVANTNLYDLGCSLGKGTFAIQNAAPTSSVVFAVDSSEAMTTRLMESLRRRDRIAAKRSPPKSGSAASEPATSGPKESSQTLSNSFAQVNVLHQDILETSLTNSSLIVLNFTLQFIPVEKRDALLKHCFDALIEGGALLLSEKTKQQNLSEQALISDLHHDFKRDQGYSDLEISRKRDAITKMLIPETINEHRDRLKGAGFQTIAVWMECLGFTSLVAVKKDE